MKNLLSDPVGWSESAVGNVPSFVLAVVGQIVGAWLIWRTHGAVWSTVVFTIVVPSFYLYALRAYVASHHTRALPTFRQQAPQLFLISGFSVAIVLLIFILR